MLKCFLLVFFALGVKVWAADGDSQTSVITIVNANKTEYVKDSVTKEEQIVLTGAVVVEVAQGSTKTKISASKISYNRETNILYAQGDVVMEQTGGKAGEQKITAQTVLFNTLTYEGIFDGGRVVQTQSDAINLPSGSTLVVSSSMFGKNSENTIVFKNASLTFCDDENPHWRIRATKIWVLPGGEFAFFNAMLFIGEIPVLYLPAFYYPKDEIIFNPTFGYDTRRGYYFQTTTYIYGRKPLEVESASSSEDDDKDDELGKGLYNFMKPTKLKEQRREGIVLHNLDEDYTGDTSNYLKLMLDHYSTLGTMVGFDAVFKPEKYLSSFNANLNLGFSNTVFMDSTGEVYTPYSSTGESYKDKANLLGIKTPFRYSGNLAVSGTSPFNFKVSMPIYSDPYFTDDFGERTEYMDWISFLTRGAKDEDDEE
ncbi:MAG: LPS-assembly protein LptD, partial [Treponema sp.]|nr:LPS-assembly protein LptD [Treponema sp.]